MKKRAALCLFVMLFFATFASGQCSILSDSVVCVNDFISFQVQSTGAIDSYSWDFDDGQTSTQATPFVKYSQYGHKNIQVIIKLAGGGSCTATKVIQAHPLPVADFTIDAGSNYCLSRNSVCINDASKPGQTQSAIAKRVVLFGDGAADISFNPTAQTKVCHSYNKEGTYTIIIEVTDIKGCIARNQKDVTIVKDVKALYGYQLVGNCDTASLCLFNLSQTDSTTMKKWYWDFGNGVVDSTNWSSRCFIYRDSGTFSPRLIIQSKVGCNDTFQQNQLINLNPIVFDVVKDKYEVCFGNGFTFQDNGPVKDKYFWYFRDSGDLISHPWGQGNPFTSPAEPPGKRYISLTVHRGKCISTFLWDSVLVRGPVANAIVRNKTVCVAGDTTYFCDASNYDQTIGVKRLWDFGDKYCSACTTNTAKGINVGMNCRYSEDPSPKHLYLTDTCYTASLHLKDTVTGCEWQETFGIQIGKPKPETIQFSYTNDKACTGNAQNRTFFFAVNGNCYPYRICPDSAASQVFYPGLQSWKYPALSNANGYVTVGLILESGSALQPACPGFSNSPMCTDTFWYHHWIHIIPEPKPFFEPDVSHGCAPLQVNYTMGDTADTTLVQAVWDWGDGQIDTIALQQGTPIPKTFSHTYLINGQFSPKLSLTNKRGCELGSSDFISVGHQNEFEFKEKPCINDCLTFSDSTRYYGDTSYYWTYNWRNGIEKMWWSFSDGYTDTVTHPVRCFKDTGTYQIQLITLDSSGCYDTSVASLNIGGIKAGIEGKDVILCSEIVQFKDSSVLSSSQMNEAVVGWYWDFGDGTTPSYLEDPYHFFSSFGDFTVRLITLTNRECVDTAYKKVNVFGPIPSFEFITDSIGCAPMEVEIKNTSRQVKNWIWYFGDPGNNTLATLDDSNVKFTYDKPGTYYLKLYGADSIFNPSTGNNQFCSFVYPDTKLPGQIERKVIVLPYLAVGFASPDTVCRDQNFTLLDMSDARYTDFRWYFDQTDSLLTQQKAITWRFDDTGYHWVELMPTYVPGTQERACFDSASKKIYVVDILADFDFDPRSTPLEKWMDNLSQGATEYSWDFGHPKSGNRNTSTLFEPRHNYNPDRGKFVICLKVTNKFGCVDSICKEVELVYNPRIWIPNVITPGNTPENDAFDIDIEGEEEYGLKIYNRWGDLVFEGNQDGVGNDGINWNGTLKDGSEASAGVYYVVFDYKFYYTDAVRYTGTLTLIR